MSDFTSQVAIAPDLGNYTDLLPDQLGVPFAFQLGDFAVKWVLGAPIENSYLEIKDKNQSLHLAAVGDHPVKGGFVLSAKNANNEMHATAVQDASSEHSGSIFKFDLTKNNNKTDKTLQISAVGGGIGIGDIRDQSAANNINMIYFDLNDCELAVWIAWPVPSLPTLFLQFNRDYKGFIRGTKMAD